MNRRGCEAVIPGIREEIGGMSQAFAQLFSEAPDHHVPMLIDTVKALRAHDYKKFCSNFREMETWPEFKQDNV